ncbi:hypothetical protein SNEBB_007669 [Seison nebaliae]|nr:hypothetical protein SNEBB_007669 [Seison nebaliae]
MDKLKLLILTTILFQLFFWGLVAELSHCPKLSCSKGANCVLRINCFSKNQPKCVYDLCMKCLCNPCYVGKYCDQPINDKCSNYCVMGTCTLISTMYGCSRVCRCFDRYEGKRCEKIFVDCSIWKCENSGTCILDNDIPKCLCQENYSGTHCEHRTISHNGKLCLNGGYINEITDNCICPKNFFGTLCEETICNRLANVCHNGGKCYPSNTLSNFFCKCQESYEGSYCNLKKSTNNNFCSSSMCQHGGKCEMKENGKKICKYVCDSWNCNEGTCVLILSKHSTTFSLKPICICNYHYEGVNCEKSSDSQMAISKFFSVKLIPKKTTISTENLEKIKKKICLVNQHFNQSSGKCLCDNGFILPNCTKHICDDVHKYPCNIYNSMKCIRKLTKPFYRCICKLGINGEKCENFAYDDCQTHGKFPVDRRRNIHIPFSPYSKCELFPRLRQAAALHLAYAKVPMNVDETKKFGDFDGIRFLHLTNSNWTYKDLYEIYNGKYQSADNYFFGFRFLNLFTFNFKCNVIYYMKKGNSTEKIFNMKNFQILDSLHLIMEFDEDENFIFNFAQNQKKSTRIRISFNEMIKNEKYKTINMFPSDHSISAYVIPQQQITNDTNISFSRSFIN